MLAHAYDNLDSHGMLYPLVDRNQDPRLCVFRRQDVTIDSHPPALVSPNLDIAVHTVNKRRQFGSKEEDVDTTVLGEAVECVRD